MTEQDLLVGKTILSVKIATDRMALLFSFNDGTSLVARTDGDCCSQTWIEHVELPTEFPAKIISAGSIELNIDDVTNDDYECLSFYGYKISTDKGDMVIDYRNSSNGYYGGDIVFGKREDWPEDEYYSFYGGVYGQNISNEEWEDIK